MEWGVSVTDRGVPVTIPRHQSVACACAMVSSGRRALTDELARQNHVGRVDATKDLRLLHQWQALEEFEEILRVLESDGFQRVLECLHRAGAVGELGRRPAITSVAEGFEQQLHDATLPCRESGPHDAFRHADPAGRVQHDAHEKERRAVVDHELQHRRAVRQRLVNDRRMLVEPRAHAPRHLEARRLGGGHEACR